MINLFSIFNFDKGSSSTANVFKIENTVIELDFSMVSADTLIQNQYLIRAMSTNFSSILFN